MFRRLVTLVLFLAPAIALAQEAAQQDAPSSADTALTIYAALASVLTAVIGWLSVRVSAWLKANTKNATIAGVLARLSDSVFTAVKHVNQTLKREIEAAKDPKSPGGAAITQREAQQMKDAVWNAIVAEYGGMGGLSKALGVLGLVDESSIRAFVDKRIEAAVHDTKGP